MGVNEPSISLSIIIVNFRSSDLILDALHSIYQFNANLDFEVIIVDNSDDAVGKEKIQKFYPELNWIQMPYNAGFSRANNAGIRVAKGDCVLLLNPDTVSIDDSIQQCYYKLRNSPYVAAGVQLLDIHRQPQISGNFFVKGGLNHLLPIPYWGDFIRWVGYKAKAKVPNVQEANEVEDVDWISGAFLMVKKEAVEKAGLMDEDFFLYGEEVEWCSRLKKTGNLAIFGNLHMIHLEGATINESQNIKEKGYYNLYDKKGLQLMVSNHLRVRKQYGVGWFLFLLSNYCFGVIVFLLFTTIHQLFLLKNPFQQWDRVGAYARNVLALLSLSPKIISNKPYFYKMFGS